MKCLWCALLVLLIAGNGVNADDKDPSEPNELPPMSSDAVIEDANDPNDLLWKKRDAVVEDANDPNDPNELLWKKWDAVIKDPNDPNELLRAKWDAIVSVLQNKDFDQKTKEMIVGKIVGPFFDFPLIAKLSLGRKHWPKLNQQQRKKFTRLFTKHLMASYLNKISLYTDEKASLKPALRKGNIISIPMELISRNKNISILYKIRKVDKTWKVYDMEIQGVSVLLTYRSQFDDILRKNSVENLLSRLEKPLTR